MQLKKKFTFCECQVAKTPTSDARFLRALSGKKALQKLEFFSRGAHHRAK